MDLFRGHISKYVYENEEEEQLYDSGLFTAGMTLEGTIESKSLQQFFR